MNKKIQLDYNIWRKKLIVNILPIYSFSTIYVYFEYTFGN